MASPTRWTWIWVNSGSWWWTERPGVLWFMGSQRLDTTERLNWTELIYIYIYIYIHTYTHTYKSIYNFILKRAWNLVEKRHVNINYTVEQCMKMWHKAQKKHRIWFNLFVLGKSLFCFSFSSPLPSSLPFFPLLPLLLLKKKGHLALNFGKISCLPFIPWEGPHTFQPAFH